MRRSRKSARCGLVALLLLVSSPALAKLERPQLQLSQEIRIDQPVGTAAAALGAPMGLRLADDLHDSQIREALAAGRSMVGTRYRLGAAHADDAVDCSSLVQRMFERVGIALPRTTHEQVVLGHPVTPAALEPGDLLFYRFGKRGMHVGVYVDEGHVLHASTSAHRVVVSALDEAWRRRMVAARRL